MVRLSTAVGTVHRPGAALAEISGNPRPHLASAVIMFAAACALDVYSSLAHAPVPAVADAGSNYALYAAMTSVQAVAGPLLAFAVILYAGRAWGGTGSFEKVFSVLSHCLVPVIACVAIVVLSGMSLPGGLIVGGEYRPDPTAEADYVSDMIMLNLIVWPFVVWYVALTTKAVKIMNGFGTKKALAVVGLSMVSLYLSASAFGALFEAAIPM